MPFQITTPHHQCLLNEIYPTLVTYTADRESCDVYREGGHPLGIVELVNQGLASMSKIEQPKRIPTIKLSRETSFLDRRVMKEFFTGSKDKKDRPDRERIDRDESDGEDKSTNASPIKSSFKLFGRTSTQSTSSSPLIRQESPIPPDLLASPGQRFLTNHSLSPSKSYSEFIETNCSRSPLNATSPCSSQGTTSKKYHSKHLLEPPHLPNATKLSLFLHYINYKPGKISKVMAYFERRIKYDMSHGYTNYLLVSIEIIKSLLSGASAHVTLFYSSILKLIALICNLSCITSGSLSTKLGCDLDFTTSPLISSPIHLEILRNCLIAFWMLCRLLKGTSLLQGELNFSNFKGTKDADSVMTRKFSMTSGLSTHSSIRQSSLKENNVINATNDRVLFYSFVAVSRCLLFSPNALKLWSLGKERAVGSLGGVDRETRQISVEVLLMALQCDQDIFWSQEMILGLYFDPCFIYLSYNSEKEFSVPESPSSEIYCLLISDLNELSLEENERQELINARLMEQREICRHLFAGILRYNQEVDSNDLIGTFIMTKPAINLLEERQAVIFVKYLCLYLRACNCHITSPLLRNKSRAQDGNMELEYQLNEDLLEETSCLLVKLSVLWIPQKYIHLLLKEIIASMDYLLACATTMDTFNSKYMFFQGWLTYIFVHCSTHELILLFPTIIKSLLNRIFFLSTLPESKDCSEMIRTNQWKTVALDSLRHTMIAILMNPLSSEMTFDFLALYLSKIENFRKSKIFEKLEHSRSVEKTENSEENIKTYPHTRRLSCTESLEIFSTANNFHGSSFEISQSSLVLIVDEYTSQGSIRQESPSPDSKGIDYNLSFSDDLLKEKFSALNKKRLADLQIQHGNILKFDTPLKCISNERTNQASSLMKKTDSKLDSKLDYKLDSRLSSSTSMNPLDGLISQFQYINFWIEAISFLRQIAFCLSTACHSLGDSHPQKEKRKGFLLMTYGKKESGINLSTGTNFPKNTQLGKLLLWNALFEAILMPVPLLRIEATLTLIYLLQLERKDYGRASNQTRKASNLTNSIPALPNIFRKSAALLELKQEVRDAAATIEK